MNITSNARTIANRYRRRIRALNGALAKGLRKAAAAIDREQVANLSGAKSDPPGSYPVPVRKGTLRGGHGWAVNDHKRGAVFNTTEYAMAIHNDRPFLDDAVEAVDYPAIVAGEVRKGMAIQ